MTTTKSIQAERLASALNLLGVSFVHEDHLRDETLHSQPGQLIRALAQSEEARLRLSLIPLFLDHPEFSSHVLHTVGRLDPAGRLTLRCYYTAAVFFQQKFQTTVEIKQPLPDLFSRELGLICSTEPDENLKELAVRQQALSGSKVNWLGTYQHAIKIWLKTREMRKL